MKAVTDKKKVPLWRYGAVVIFYQMVLLLGLSYIYQKPITFGLLPKPFGWFLLSGFIFMFWSDIRQGIKNYKKSQNDNSEKQI